MHLESLESRTHFSGVVTINLNSNLISGDDEANDFSLGLQSEDGPPIFIILNTNHNTTLKVNGEVLDEISMSVGGSWTIDLGKGDDNLNIYGTYEDQVQFRKLSIILGEGNDRLTLGSTFGRLAVDGGTGNDRIYLGGDQRSPLATGNIFIDGGPGRDYIQVIGNEQTNIGGSLWIQDMSGPSSILLSHLNVRKSTLISTGNSIDRITATDNTFRNPFILGTRAGNDIINLTGSIFRSTKDIFPGSGSNTIIP